jgi:hypothetical protein
VIEEAARRLSQGAPGARVILFGSHARGDAGSRSDLDFLVAEPEVERRGEVPLVINGQQIGPKASPWGSMVAVVFRKCLIPA